MGRVIVRSNINLGWPPYLCQNRILVSTSPYQFHHRLPIRSGTIALSVPQVSNNPSRALSLNVTWWVFFVEP